MEKKSAVQLRRFKYRTLYRGERSGQQDNADTNIFPDKQQIDWQRRAAVGEHAPPDKYNACGGDHHRNHERETGLTPPFDAVGQRERDNEGKCH